MFKGNLKYKGDIQLVAYIDFQTTWPTDECLDLENRKMFVVLQVILYAFHPDLDIDCVIIEHSFGHSPKKLTSFNYLISKELDFKDNKTLLQLIDCTLAFAEKKRKLQF